MRAGIHNLWILLAWIPALAGMAIKNLVSMNIYCFGLINTETVSLAPLAKTPIAPTM